MKSIEMGIKGIAFTVG